jgi:hypothetical protein
LHDDIKKFSLSGLMGDNNIVRGKEILVKNLEDQMRDTGFVPVLDLEPQFTLDYNAQDEQYNFELTVYGAYVGKDKSWDTAGLMTGKPIMRSITSPK